jgi:hypothetical protein
MYVYFKEQIAGLLNRKTEEKMSGQNTDVSLTVDTCVQCTPPRVSPKVNYGLE